jgi:chromate reductase, NAD(P)H dehydrogenase (quinone)
LLATSPGARGGQTVLENALNRFPRHGANIVGSFHFPSFHQNFQDNQVINLEIKNELENLTKFITV